MTAESTVTAASDATFEEKTPLVQNGSKAAGLTSTNKKLILVGLCMTTTIASMVYSLLAPLFPDEAAAKGTSNTGTSRNSNSQFAEVHFRSFSRLASQLSASYSARLPVLHSSCRRFSVIWRAPSEDVACCSAESFSSLPQPSHLDCLPRSRIPPSLLPAVSE